MKTDTDAIERLGREIAATPSSGKRRLVALAGPPGSGKSTLATQLASSIERAGRRAEVAPMDGFHLDNGLLTARGLLHRKGAPETFDLAGFARLVTRLKDEEEVIYPKFDRDRDLAIAGAGVIGPECETVVVEGNYLLLDAPGWRDLSAHWDFRVYLDVPEEELTRRLVGRWLAHGLTWKDAEQRANANDLPNARLVASALVGAPITRLSAA